MEMQMPLLKKCCFCVPLRYGLLAWAYVRLILTIFFTTYTLLALSVQIVLIFIEVTTPGLWLKLSPLILCFIDMVFNFALIVGCHKKHISSLRLYLWFGISYALVFLLLYVTCTTLILIAARKAHRNTSKVWSFVTFFSLISGTVLILHIYLMLMVCSEISRLNQLPAVESKQSVPSHIKQADSLP